MKRILVFSGFFPPTNSSEGNVTYKLLKASKNKYDVFTTKPSRNFSYEITEYPEIKNTNIIFSSNDDFKKWKEEALKFFEENSEKYDIIMTRSMPEESHEIGLIIKKAHPEIKWIASFGDPIANNPYHKLSEPYSPYYRDFSKGIRYVLSPKRMLLNFRWKHVHYKKYLKLINGNSNLQEDVISYADNIILNSENQRDYMVKDEEQLKKCVVLNHSFDPELYPKKSKKNDKLVFTYVGLCDMFRSPGILFDAISRLKEYDPDLKDKVEFKFYGKIDNDDKIKVIDNDIYDIVKIKGSVDYFESLQVMKDADYLLHIDANIVDIVSPNIFFAAKIADYIGTGNKIFAITAEEGSANDIISDYNGEVATYSSNDIFNRLFYIIYKNNQKEINKECMLKYSNTDVAAKFDKMIVDLLR